MLTSINCELKGLINDLRSFFLDDQDDLEESDMSGPIDFTNLKGLSVKITDGGTRAVSNDTNEGQSKTLPDEKENNQKTPPDDDYSDYVPVTESPESPDNNDVEMPQENGKENGEKNGEKSALPEKSVSFDFIKEQKRNLVFVSCENGH